MVTEVRIISTWLQAILTGDTGAGGIVALAPGGVHDLRDTRQSGVYPKVIHRRQGGGYVQTANGIIVALQGVYAVYGIWPIASAGQELELIAIRIRTLLHLKQGTSTGGYVLASVAIEPIDLQTLERDTEVRMRGELLRIHGQAT